MELDSVTPCSLGGFSPSEQRTPWEGVGALRARKSHPAHAPGCIILGKTAPLRRAHQAAIERRSRRKRKKKEIKTRRKNNSNAL